MKKKVLLLASLVLVIAVVMGTFVKGNMSKAGYTEADDDMISYKITIPSNYFSARYVSEVLLHYGVNGWNNPQDAVMYVTTGEIKYGVPSKYEFNAVIKVHKGDTIDYCYKVTNGSLGSNWQNNNGEDFHVVANESNVKEIQYEIDWQPEARNIAVNGDVTLHYGINGWDDVKDVKMVLKSKTEIDGKTYSWYKALVTVEEGSTINYCVKADTADGEKWDNNNEKDYTVVANQEYTK